MQNTSVVPVCGCNTLLLYQLFKKLIPTQKTSILYGPEQQQTIPRCHLLSILSLLIFSTTSMLLSKVKVGNLVLWPRGMEKKEGE